MAKKVTVNLVDDYDGKSTAQETVRFGVDGVEYEIDLSNSNADKLREVLAPWAQAARRVGRTTQPKKRGGRARPRGERQRSAAIRAWARTHGYTVADSGRLQAHVIDAYVHAAQHSHNGSVA
ncbi:Lsr2 family protein [Nocardia africana]|uniref:Lsr2 family protein n=1 Tax=Nocardia africana TaxID=134964 RepID=A0ABW6NTS6_9NOCA